MSDASVYRCPSCGAPNAPRAVSCEWCRAELNPVRCPWCFAWIDARAQGCARCGSRAAPPTDTAAGACCPNCRDEKKKLFGRALGRVRLSVCGICAGLWADSESFKLLCEDRSVQAAYMGRGSILPAPARHDPSAAKILYRPCPVCREMMNRFNFANCSGVILDVCKPHGVWFDADDLERIVDFIRGGGLDVAREHEREVLELERKRLEKAAEDMHGPRWETQAGATHFYAASDLLRHLFDS